MSLQINKVTGVWKNALPTTADLNGKIVGEEARISWGFPPDAHTAQSGYGFRGSFPPVKFVKKGERFLLGRLRHFNHPIDCPCLSTVDLEVTIDAARNGQHSGTISLSHDETDNITGDPVLDSDIVTVTGGFPQDITFTANNGTARIRLIGFQTEDGDIVEEFTSPERSANQVWLVAELIDDGEIDPECDDPADSVFDPVGCEIDCVLPIEDTPIIIDCDIPEAPEAITDCEPIDIPTAVIIDPPIDPPFCRPDVIVSYGFTCVDKREDVKVVIFTFPIGECSTLIYFYFYLYCPKEKEEECCWWVWCPCDDGYCDSGWSLATSTDCPHTDMCTEVEGEWVLFKGDAGDCTYPPCNEGDYYGQTEIICDCPCESSSSSSSSSSLVPGGPEDCCCWDDDDLNSAPECLDVAMNGLNQIKDDPDCPEEYLCTCNYIDPDEPCVYPDGTEGNSQICKIAQGSAPGPVGPLDLPEDSCLVYHGNLDLKCPALIGPPDKSHLCLKEAVVWFYCYEQNGETYWAFYAALSPDTHCDPMMGPTPMTCWITKTGIVADDCDPFSVTFVIESDDHNLDGELNGCENCEFVITITEADPED